MEQEINISTNKVSHWRGNKKNTIIVVQSSVTDK